MHTLQTILITNENMNIFFFYEGMIDRDNCTILALFSLILSCYMFASTDGGWRQQ